MPSVTAEMHRTVDCLVDVGNHSVVPTAVAILCSPSLPERHERLIRTSIPVHAVARQRHTGAGRDQSTSGRRLPRSLDLASSLPSRSSNPVRLLRVALRAWVSGSVLGKRQRAAPRRHLRHCERDLVIRKAPHADQVQPGADVWRFVAHRTAAIGCRTAALFQHLVSRRVEHHIRLAIHLRSMSLAMNCG